MAGKSERERVRVFGRCIGQIETWCIHFNHCHPHSVLGWMTPYEFAKNLPFDLICSRIFQIMTGLHMG
ncbi:transposase [Pantoea sp. RSPAM1]